MREIQIWLCHHTVLPAFIIVVCLEYRKTKKLYGIQTKKKTPSLFIQNTPHKAQGGENQVVSTIPLFCF